MATKKFRFEREGRSCLWRQGPIRWSPAPLSESLDGWPGAGGPVLTR